MRHVLFTLLALLAITTVTAQTPCSGVLGFNATMAPMAGYPLRVAVANTNNISLPVNGYGHLTYSWGDNTTPGYASLPATSGTTVYHNYAAPGTYTIRQKISVYDSTTFTLVCTDSVDQQFTVAAAPCAASFSHTQTGNTFVFTATNLAGTPGLTYTWDFGDGSFGTGSPITHTYASMGNKFVKLITSAGPPASCTDSASKWVFATGPNPQLPLNCNNLTANFGFSAVNQHVAFYNYSSTVNLPAYRTYFWDFGDGTTSTGTAGPHNYAAPGTYTVKLVMTWQNSVSVCVDSITKTVVVSTPPAINKISGLVSVDTADADTSMQIRVWLIEYDSLTTTLTAVDSTMAWYLGSGYFNYEFNGHPAGSYRTKAHLLNGPTSGTGYIPTYHTSHLYWSAATVINHAGGNTPNKYISMQKGTITGGPGFVGGNVSLGANKGTGAGLANMLIIVRDNNNIPVQSAFTDNNGNFAISNLPLGSYNVYPEDMGYATTPAMFTITAGQPSVLDMNFERSDNAKTITPVGTGIQDANANTYAIYPNPSNGVVYIQSTQEFKNATVNVTDITGRIVYSTALTSGTVNKVDISALQNGLYYITVKADNATHTEKVMLTH